MPRYCQSCGSSMDDNARFCGECGTSADANKTVTSPASAPPPPPPQTMAYSAPYTSSYTSPPQPATPSYYTRASGPPQITNWPPVSVGQYIGMFILSGIPVLGFILMLIWAFGSNENPGKQNYARAVLILMVIGVVLAVLLSAVLIPLLRSVFEAADFTYY